MARETKQDRIVRVMLDQVAEHLHELKGLEANPGTKESDVEKWVQGFLKSCLGYMASAGYSIRSQESKGKHRPDLTLFKDEKPILVIEVKKLGFNLNKSDFRSGKVQIGEYLQALGNVKWGILTNGFEWKLFDFSNPEVGGIEVSCFHLKDDDQPIDTSKRAVEECCYEVLDFHATSFESGAWTELSKEATVFSPESLARAIMSYDVVKYISRTIRGEHEYKANFEVLCDRIHTLLEQGLDDAQPGWNEGKAIELHKYIRAQKRVSRKARKPKASSDSKGNLEITKDASVDTTIVAVGEKPNVA